MNRQVRCFILTIFAVLALLAGKAYAVCSVSEFDLKFAEDTIKEITREIRSEKRDKAREVKRLREKTRSFSHQLTTISLDINFLQEEQAIEEDSIKEGLRCGRTFRSCLNRRQQLLRIKRKFRLSIARAKNKMTQTQARRDAELAAINEDIKSFNDSINSLNKDLDAAKAEKTSIEATLNECLLAGV